MYIFFKEEEEEEEMYQNITKQNIKPLSFAGGHSPNN